MRSSRINYVIVGVFVLAMLAALIAALTMMTGRMGDTADYYTYYDNVGGIKYGTQVMVEGFHVGQVEEIIPETGRGKPRFKLRMAIDSQWKIPEDSIAHISASGLLAAISIDIKSGESTVAIKPGEVIASAQSGGVFAALNDIASEVTDLSRSSVRPLLDNLNKYVEALGSSLVDGTPEIVNDLKVAIADLSTRMPQITESVASFAKNLDEDVLGDHNRTSLRTTVDNVQVTAETFAQLARDLRDLKSNVSEAIATLENMINNADATMTGVAEMVDDNKANVADTIKEMRYSMKSISRRIDTITYNLDGTARNMFEFSRSIRQNPGLLLGGTPPTDEARPAQ